MLWIAGFDNDNSWCKSCLRKSDVLKAEKAEENIGFG
jgi:hypothetical protein